MRSRHDSGAMPYRWLQRGRLQRVLRHYEKRLPLDSGVLPSLLQVGELSHRLQLLGVTGDWI
jgi:hypothetical protein